MAGAPAIVTISPGLTVWPSIVYWDAALGV